jgi:outer membrane lipoprotein SlyB
MKSILFAAAALAVLAGAPLANANPVEGAAIGAGSGLLIAGPPGAIVGGVAGAVVGSRRGHRVARVRHSRAWYRHHRAQH